MSAKEADLQSLVNALKERPDLLKSFNRTIADVLEAAGVEPGDLDLEEVLEIIRQSKDEP